MSEADGASKAVLRGFQEVVVESATPVRSQTPSRTRVRAKTKIKLHRFGFSYPGQVNVRSEAVSDL